MNNRDKFLPLSYLLNKASKEEIEDVQKQIRQGVSDELWIDSLKEYENLIQFETIQDVDHDFQLMFSKICKKINIPDNIA